MMDPYKGMNTFQLAKAKYERHREQIERKRLRSAIWYREHKPLHRPRERFLLEGVWHASTNRD